jgi:hypothetical protein
MGRRTIVLILALTAGLPAGYAGLTIARVAAITYNMRADDPMMLQFGIISAEAMVWRDTRG